MPVRVLAGVRTSIRIGVAVAALVVLAQPATATADDGLPRIGPEPGAIDPDSGYSQIGAIDGPDESAPPVEVNIDRAPSGDKYVAGQLLVTYSQSASGAAVREAIDAVGAETGEKLEEIDVRIVALPEIGQIASQDRREDTLAVAKRELAAAPGIESVTYNHTLEPAANFNDPLQNFQWGLGRIGINAAWDASTGAGTRVAIIDSGLDFSHPEFSGAVLAQAEYFTLTPDGIAEDNTGHGTHVAGIASANTNNGQGVAGTSPQSALLIAKVCDQVITCNTGAAAQALIDTANYPGGVDVANMSLGTFNPDPALEGAVNYATSRDLLVVAAAGNEARIDPFYPAAYSNAIAVSSTSFGDTGSDFSDFGDWVDISAPGGFNPKRPERGGHPLHLPAVRRQLRVPRRHEHGLPLRGRGRRTARGPGQERPPDPLGARVDGHRPRALRQGHHVRRRQARRRGGAGSGEPAGELHPSAARRRPGGLREGQEEARPRPSRAQVGEEERRQAQGSGRQEGRQEGEEAGQEGVRLAVGTSPSTRSV